MNKKNDESKKKVKIYTILLGIIICIIVIVSSSAISIYIFNSHNTIVQTLQKIIPFPAVIVDRKQIITIKKKDENIKAVRRFYENQNFPDHGVRIDFNSDDGKKRLKIQERLVLDKLIEDRAIELIAKKNKIKITDAQVDIAVERQLKEYNAEDATEKKLEQIYGWKINKFKEEIVKPSLYKNALKKYFEENIQDTKEAQKEIETAYSELQKKVSFEDVARKYSDGSTKESGGAVGFFKKEYLIPEIADIVDVLLPASNSGIIESELGFHIIKINEIKEENNENLYNISQILIRKKIFADYLDEQMKQINVWVPLKEFTWDQQSAHVVFTDPELRKLEEGLDGTSRDKKE